MKNTTPAIAVRTSAVTAMAIPISAPVVSPPPALAEPDEVVGNDVGLVLDLPEEVTDGDVLDLITALAVDVVKLELKLDV